MDGIRPLEERNDQEKKMTTMSVLFRRSFKSRLASSLYSVMSHLSKFSDHIIFDITVQDIALRDIEGKINQRIIHITIEIYMMNF